MAIIPPFNPTVGTLDRFGVPVFTTETPGQLLMPKLKHRFRVLALTFGGFAPIIDFTRQVVTCGRPNQQFNNTPLHSYNNITYIAQKPEWQPIELTLRDDINNSASSLVSQQITRQMNHYTQAAAPSHTNYKFSMRIQTLDGTMGRDNVLEEWVLEGCYVEQVQYDSMDYASSDPVIITLSIRYDNATQGSELILEPIPASRAASPIGQ